MKYRSCPFDFPWVSLGCLWADVGLALAPFNPFGLHLAVLWAPFGPFASLLGSPWAPFGRPLGSFGRPLESLWRSLGAHGIPWAALGPPLQTSSSMFTVCDACRQNQASWNTPREPREPREPRKWCQELRLGAHLPHAPGARMTVVTQTPSN